MVRQLLTAVYTPRAKAKTQLFAVWPDVRPGVRLQLTLSWPVLSIVGTFDAFPPIRGEPVAYYGAALTQLGF